MLTLQQIKADPAHVVARLAVKGFDGKAPIDNVLALDAASCSSTMTTRRLSSTASPPP